MKVSCVNIFTSVALHLGFLGSSIHSKLVAVCLSFFFCFNLLAVLCCSSVTPSDELCLQQIHKKYAFIYLYAGHFNIFWLVNKH